MVAYSFKSGFLTPIRERVKRQTIRLPRKRHARAGEALQFFTGPRMRPVKVGTAVCVAARTVRLDFEADVVDLDDAIRIECDADLNAFAERDGFGGRQDVPPWEVMARWWRLTHPDQPVFAGVLIDWTDTFTPAAASAPSTPSPESGHEEPPYRPQ